MGFARDQLQDAINKSQYGKPDQQEDFWYSYSNQKVLAFEVAKELIIAGESIDDSIATAKTFVDTFYQKAMRPGSWER